MGSTQDHIEQVGSEEGRLKGTTRTYPSFLQWTASGSLLVRPNTGGQKHTLTQSAPRLRFPGKEQIMTNG